MNVAQKYNLSPAQMALAYVRSRWFVTSTIIGATNLEQLKENINSAEIELSREILQDIDAVHFRYPNPTP